MEQLAVDVPPAHPTTRAQAKAPSSPNMTISISRLSIERYESGFAVQHPTPRLSWRFSGDTLNWLQASYDVRIERQDGVKDYHVDSQENIMVSWPGEPLRSRERTKVSVKSNGEDGTSTEWKTLNVEGALLQPSDWKATMVTGEDQPRDAAKRPFLFTTAIKLDSAPSVARMYATAHGLYEVEINGSRVGDHLLAPGWQNYRHRLHYQVYDIAPFLNVGTNYVGVHVAEGWYAGRIGFNGGQRNIYGDRVAFMAQIEVDDKIVAATGEKWLWSYGPLLSAEIYDGEVFDSRKDETMFDGPWHPVKVLERPNARMLTAEASPVRKTLEVKAKNIIKTPSGKTVIDFGQNLVGYLRMNKNPDVPPGQTITLTHAEVIEHGELCTRPLQIAKCQDVIITGGNLTNWSPHFTFHGFQFAQIDGYPNVDMDTFTAIVIHTDMQRTGFFESSHALINQLHSNVTWSLRSNFVSIPTTDGPQRDERLGRTGNVEAFAPTAAFLYDVSGILGNWLEELAVEQNTEGGIPPLLIPSVLQKVHPPLPPAVLAVVTALTSHHLYMAFGDVRFLRDQYQSMTSWLDKGVLRDEKTNLWRKDLMQLGDWLDPKAPPDSPGDARTDPELVADAFLVHVTKVVAEISERLGEKESAAKYREQHAALRRAFRVKYISESGRMVSDSQTAFALALRFGLFDEEQLEMALSRLDFLIRKEVYKIGTGFAGTPVILQVLADNGKLSLAYHMLQEVRCPSWLYPVTMGATTIWERLGSISPDGTIHPGEMTSFNHCGFGAVASFLHQYVGGISPLEPGWKKIKIQPMLGGTVTSARVRHTSPYGDVACEWQISQGKLKVKVTIPPNCSGEVVLPGLSETIGSGRRTFEVDWEADES